MTSYTVADLGTRDGDLRQVYLTQKERYMGFDFSGLDVIFEVALNQQDRFPNIVIPNNATTQEYIARWISGYVTAMNNKPSMREANAKSACSDPAIRRIVQVCQGVSKDEAIRQENHHNLFMSAENIQGSLLEEYIAQNITPYGWVWCTGNVLRAVDFCNSTGSYLLRVKNKSNTENSSSSNIREGTSIKKWYRLGTRTLAGKKVPVYRWDDLNETISHFSTQGQTLPPCVMTEESYHEFLTKVAMRNRNLITEL